MKYSNHCDKCDSICILYSKTSSFTFPQHRAVMFDCVRSQCQTCSYHSHVGNTNGHWQIPPISGFFFLFFAGSDRCGNKSNCLPATICSRAVVAGKSIVSWLRHATCKQRCFLTAHRRAAPLINVPVLLDVLTKILDENKVFDILVVFSFKRHLMWR